MIPGLRASDALLVRSDRFVMLSSTNVLRSSFTLFACLDDVCVTAHQDTRRVRSLEEQLVVGLGSNSTRARRECGIVQARAPPPEQKTWARACGAQMASTCWARRVVRQSSCTSSLGDWKMRGDSGRQ